MAYSIALRNGVNPKKPLNGCMFLLCPIHKCSYVLRPVSVHWMYKKCHIGNFFNVQRNNEQFEFLFVIFNQELDFTFF